MELHLIRKSHRVSLLRNLKVICISWLRHNTHGIHHLEKSILGRHHKAWIKLRLLVALETLILLVVLLRLVSVLMISMPLLRVRRLLGWLMLTYRKVSGVNWNVSSVKLLGSLVILRV